MQIKTQWNTTAHLLEQLKQKIIIANAREEAEKLDLPYIAGGYVKWYSYCGKWFGSF